MNQLSMYLINKISYVFNELCDSQSPIKLRKCKEFSNTCATLKNKVVGNDNLLLFFNHPFRKIEIGEIAGMRRDIFPMIGFENYFTNPAGWNIHNPGACQVICKICKPRVVPKDHDGIVRIW